MHVIQTREGIRYREKIYIDGKCHHSPRFAKKTDAANWKARMTNDRAKYLASGVLPPSLQPEETLTFGEYANRWLETRVKLQLSQRTYEHYASTLKCHLLPLFSETRLKDFRISHAHKLIEVTSKKGHNPKGINMIIGVLKRIAIEANRESILEKNPFQFLKEMKEMPRPDVYLTSSEIAKVLEVSKGHIFYSLFLIAINTGMRRGELAGLCFDRINFDLNLIEISRIRDRNGLEERTKTFTSRRFVPMNAVVKSHLMALKESATGNLVFTEKDGKAFDVNHLYRYFRHFLKLAGITNLYRFHDLRHTFASHFMMNGGNIYDLQKILGHTSLDMTQKYAHLAPEHLVQAANVVSFGGQYERVKLKVAPM